MSIFVTQAAGDYRRGSPDWFLLLFLILFVLVGLGLIGAVFYTFLAMFNPRVRLTLGAAEVQLGEELEVRWLVTGRVHALRRLHIFLEGREEATYRRGTSTSTDKHVFMTTEIADTAARLEMHSGAHKLRLPRTTMHSFDAPSNKIVWQLRVRGAIRFWPDVDDAFPITLLPVDMGARR